MVLYSLDVVLNVILRHIVSQFYDFSAFTSFRQMCSDGFCFSTRFFYLTLSFLFTSVLPAFSMRLMFLCFTCIFYEAHEYQRKSKNKEEIKETNGIVKFSQSFYIASSFLRNRFIKGGFYRKSGEKKQSLY